LGGPHRKNGLKRVHSGGGRGGGGPHPPHKKGEVGRFLEERKSRMEQYSREGRSQPGSYQKWFNLTFRMCMERGAVDKKKGYLTILVAGKRKTGGQHERSPEKKRKRITGRGKVRGLGWGKGDPFARE